MVGFPSLFDDKRKEGGGIADNRASSLGKDSGAAARENTAVAGTGACESDDDVWVESMDSNPNDCASEKMRSLPFQVSSGGNNFFISIASSLRDVVGLAIREPE